LLWFFAWVDWHILKNKRNSYAKKNSENLKPAAIIEKNEENMDRKRKIVSDRLK